MPFTLNLLNRKHTCKCGEVFFDNSGTSKYCPACRTQAKRSQHTQYLRRYRKRNRAEKKTVDMKA